jgi:hypothetical protein
MGVRDTTTGRARRLVRLAIEAVAFVGCIATVVVYSLLDRPLRNPWAIGLAVLSLALLAVSYAFGRRGAKQVTPGPSDAPSMEAARELALAGNRIEAIQMIRRVTGMSLADANTALKAIEWEARSSDNAE